MNAKCSWNEDEKIYRGKCDLKYVPLNMLVEMGVVSDGDKI